MAAKLNVKETKANLLFTNVDYQLVVLKRVVLPQHHYFAMIINLNI